MQDTERTAGLIAAYAAWRSEAGAKVSSKIQTEQEQYFAQFLTLGFPRRTVEDWRYTQTTSMMALPHQVAPESSTTISFPKGIERSPLLATDAWTDLTIHAVGQRSVTADLNLALVSEGTALQVPAGFRGTEPLFITHDFSETQSWSSPTLHVVVGDDAELIVIERFIGAKKGTFNALQKWNIGARANVTHVVLSEESHLSHVLSRQEVTLGERAEWQRFSLVAGRALQRQEVAVALTGEAASASFVTLHVVPEQRQAELLLTIEHQGPKTQSRQLVKGLVAAQGMSHVTGGVHITEAAKGSEARQLLRHLLLGDKAEANAKPQLKIDTDDVACSHGATITQVNAMELFYLMSRGIQKPDALQLLSDAFAKEVLWKAKDMPVYSQWSEAFDRIMTAIVRGGK